MVCKSERVTPMTPAERETLDDLIDITIANAALIADLRQNNRAMRLFIQNQHPTEYQSKFAGFWADADGRGGDLYESRLAKVRKLAAKRDLLHKKGTLEESL